MTVPNDVLVQFEDAPESIRVVVLCHLAIGGVTIAEDELNAAIRRAQLLLATGGDPRRELDVDGRAVVALADDLDLPERRNALRACLEELGADIVELPAGSATISRLLADSTAAWRGYAAALLADALADSE